jgi:long-chain acyl-CoA synthetase
LDYKNQSVVVPGTKKPGQTGHYRNGAFGLIDSQTPNGLSTLTDIFQSGLERSRNKPFLGRRSVVSSKPLTYGSYVWETYGEVDIRRRHVGSALFQMFGKGQLGGGEMETVGIWSQNRPEWQVIDIALQAYGKVGVSLYDTLGKDSVEYIINHAHLTVIFASVDHIPILLKVAPKTPLKLIVSMDDLAPRVKKILTAWADVQKVKVLELRDIEQIGKANPIEPIPARIGQIACICYTSGTTSNPKGVVLTHGHLAMACQSNLSGPLFPPDTILFSYLPLAHIYERLAEVLVMCIGGSIGYFTGDPLRLLDDVKALRPHLFPSVPRVLNKIYHGAMVAGNVPSLRGAIFRKAVAVKLEKLHTTGDNTHAIWDKLIFRKIRAVLGGNLTQVTCGSAPISPEVMDFLKIAFCCEVIEGYGMTEGCATCCRTWPKDPTSSGTVGPPQPCNEIKLIDVPAMGYGADDQPNPRGELCMRGDNCFSVYYKDPKNTMETMDDEGWLHSGDVAEIDECGRIKIIDRVKNIMKLAQGEYVALEKIENLYSSSPVVAQIYVHGDSLQSFLVAVLIPDPVQLAQLATHVLGKRIEQTDTAALEAATQHPKVNDAILAKLTMEARRNALKGFETVKRIHVSLDAFSVENGTMTPTFKIRRKDAYAKYKAELDGLYVLGEPSGVHAFKL